MSQISRESTQRYMAHLPAPHPNRTDWQTFWHDKCLWIAKHRSTGCRLDVGAIAVDHDNISIMETFNGPPSGFPHCGDVGCNVIDGHCISTLHAEENLYLLAARHGKSLTGGNIYLSHSPCVRCSPRLIQCKVSAVSYEFEYGPDIEAVKSIFHYANISLIPFRRSL